MKLQKSILFVIFTISFYRLYAGNPIVVQQFTNHSDWNFVENKGQDINPEIRFYGNQGGVYLYCQPGKISFVFTKTENDEKISEATGTTESGVGVQNPEPLHGHNSRPLPAIALASARADLILLNSNPSAQILASDQQEYYENYYTTGNADKGITNVHTYKTLTYKSIYPNIDLVLHSMPNGMKYEFVVYPGGNVNDIQMQWNGLENIKRLQDSGIEYSLALGKMDEFKPVSFQGGNIVESNFLIADNRVGFMVKGYDKTKTLVIDPTLIWGTYYGGGQETGNAVCTDASGNVLITGYTHSSSGIATSGAYQTSYGGRANAYLAKFSSSGNLLWATYYGGTVQDMYLANSVSSDASGNVFIASNTNSSGLATSGAYQTYNIAAGRSGGSEVYLAKFSESGSLSWATYYGGGDESFTGVLVAIDGFGNVYITGSSDDTSGIATKGAYQTSLPNGSQGATFLAKFSNSGSLSWATYYGGNNYDIARGVSTDSKGNVYIAGQTASTSGIATSGAYQTSYRGETSGYNAYLAKFSSSGSLAWATYFGGNGYDRARGVATDLSGNVYITGYSASTNNLSTAGAYQTINKGGAFLAKFNGSGKIDWATYYGGTGVEEAIGINTDDSENVYITGWTTSSSDIATIDGYQTSLVGNTDIFLAEFSSSGGLTWATYYGGGTYDQGNGVSIDANGDVYITGTTQSSDNIATPGAYQTTNAGNESYAFLAKFNMYGYDAGIDSFLAPVSNVCKNPIPVVVQLKNFGRTVLDSVQINLLINGTLQPVYHWIGFLSPDSSVKVNLGKFSLPLGTNKIKCWTSRPNGAKDSVPENDTSIIFVNLIPPPVINIAADTTICANSNIAIGAASKNGYSYQWSSSPGGFSSTVSNPNVNPSITTKYYITETVNATGCSNTDSVLVNVNPLPFAVTGPNKSICVGDSTMIGDLAAKEDTYIWTSNPGGFSSTVSNPVVNPQTSTNYSLSEKDTTTGCTNTHNVTITVNPLPNANTGQNSYQICLGTHIKIGAYGLPDDVYSWTSVPAGFSSTLPDPVVNPLNSTVYHLSVKDTVTGCINKNSANIFVGIAHAPVADPGPNQTICFGDSTVIGSHAVTGNIYSWVSNPPGFTSSNPVLVVIPDSTTSYLLTVTSSVGCTDFDSVIIFVNPRPHPFAGMPQNLCTGSAVQLGDSSKPGHLYAWSSKPPGFSSTLSNPVDTPEVVTEYYLKETIDSTGCSAFDSVLISVVPRPNVNFDVKNINGYEYQFTVKNPNEWDWQYHWDFGDSASGKEDTATGFTVTHTYSKNDSYAVVLTVSLPAFCRETETYDVIVDENFALNIFPNPFEIQTDINYTLVNSGHVKISLVDEIGKQIGTLLDKQLSPGEYNTYFDATKWNTRPAMYFVLFQLDDKIIVKKIIQMDSIYH